MSTNFGYSDRQSAPKYDRPAGMGARRAVRGAQTMAALTRNALSHACAGVTIARASPVRYALRRQSLSYHETASVKRPLPTARPVQSSFYRILSVAITLLLVAALAALRVLTLRSQPATVMVPVPTPTATATTTPTATPAPAPTLVAEIVVDAAGYKFQPLAGF